jgi:YggT family protein
VSSVLLDAISNVEQFVRVFTWVYVLTLVAYLLTTWVQLPLSLRPIQRFLADVCDPYLRFWRRLVPLQLGPIDFSATVGILALIVLDRIVLAVLERLH